jgi:hypothetical protein
MGEESESYTGRYHRGFLNELYGKNNYVVRSYSLGELTRGGKKNEAMQHLSDPDLSLAYMSDQKLVMLWVKDNPGWLNCLDSAGIDITYSPKIAKRLTLLTRLAYLYTKKELNEVNIGTVKPGDFSVYDVDEDTEEKFLDGANVISRELMEEMITKGSQNIDETFAASCDNSCADPCKVHGRGNPWDKERINRAIDECGTVSLRVLGPFGLVKGDAIVVPREQIPGNYDVLYCEGNAKKEIRSNDFIFVLAEPHPKVRNGSFTSKTPAPPGVWSDDQTTSWLGSWLYPQDVLYEAMLDMTETTYENIEKGFFPKFFNDASKLKNLNNLMDQFQTQSILWETQGLGIGRSIFLQERVIQGELQKISNKKRWPIPCAMYVHVANDSWLHMAGFYDADNDEHPWPNHDAITPPGSVWYHEETGRLIYNDLDFANLYNRHGGWDLDDSVKAHYRTIDGRKKIVIVRSPNSMGEYDVKDYIPGTYHPVWQKRDGSTIEFPEVYGDAPPYLEELTINYTQKDLSPKAEHDGIYSVDKVKQAVNMAIRFSGVFGIRANADMAYFFATGDYRREQLAPIESIVDACTQEQCEESLHLIEADTRNIIEEMKEKTKIIDRALWLRRVSRKLDPQVTYRNLGYAQMVAKHAYICAAYKKRYFDLVQRVPDLIPNEIFELGKRYEIAGAQLVNYYYEQMSKIPVDLETQDRNELIYKINDSFVEILMNAAANTEDLVLAMAAHVYSIPRKGQYKDTVLFQSGKFSYQNSVFNLYLDAINLYKIGADEFLADAVCDKTTHVFHDRVQYQAFLNSSDHKCS